MTEMYSFSRTAGVGGTHKPTPQQSSLCHHLDAILKPSALAPHVNKGMTPDMLPVLNGLFLAATDPKMADFVGCEWEPEWLTGCIRGEGGVCFITAAFLTVSKRCGLVI